MSRFKTAVPCSRAATTTSVDQSNNTVGEDREAVEFTAVYQPPTTTQGSQIVDGALRASTVTKPLLMVEPTAANAGAFAAGAIRSGDQLIVNGETGWQVDGRPADWKNHRSGKHHMMVIELRMSTG